MVSICFANENEAMRYHITNGTNSDNWWSNKWVHAPARKEMSKLREYKSDQQIKRRGNSSMKAEELVLVGQSAILPQTYSF